MAEASAADGLYIPLDMVLEILSRVPVKSVLRFKSVSKEWCSFLSHRHFISTHLRRSPAALLIYARKALVPVANRLAAANGHAMYVHRPANPQLDKPVTERISVFPGSDAVVFNPMAVVGAAPNGVVCISQQLFAQSFTLWNPSTRETLQIPGPDMTVPITDPQSNVIGTSTGFAVDRSEYAIIHIARVVQINVSCVEIAQVFSLRTGLWVRLGPVNFRTSTAECEAIVKGVPYWRVSVEGMGPRLMWFNLRTFSFSIEDFAWPMLGHTHMCLGQIREGSLGAIVWGHIEFFRNIHIWTRGEDGSWSETYWFNDITQLMGEIDRFVGFYVDGMIADQTLLSVPEEEDVKPFLIKLTLDYSSWEPFCRLDDAWLGTCKLLPYKESLTRLPMIQNA